MTLSYSPSAYDNLEKQVRVLSQQLKEKRERCEELEETIRQRETKEFVKETKGRVKLRIRFDLTRSESVILLKLYESTDVTHKTLYEALYGINAYETSIKIIDVFLSKIRKKIEGSGIIIHNIPYEGTWWLDDAGRRVLKEVLS